ncbi:MAG: hypothetical protein EKK55_12920 [Rhodocyclaceae bacterium]|nr:MAG: hypothetical protein EKK55_12920 [Rhodocyclaceae bacterium]
MGDQPDVTMTPVQWVALADASWKSATRRRGGRLFAHDFVPPPALPTDPKELSELRCYVLSATPRVSPGVVAVLFSGLDEAAHERGQHAGRRRLLEAAEKQVSSLMEKCAELCGRNQYLLELVARAEAHVGDAWTDILLGRRLGKAGAPKDSAAQPMSRRRAEALLNHAAAGGAEGAGEADGAGPWHTREDDL